MKQYDLTQALRQLNETVTALENALPDIVRPRRWWEAKFSVSERVEFIRAFAAARAQLFSAVAREYPALKNKGYSVHGGYIEATEDDE